MSRVIGGSYKGILEQDFVDTIREQQQCVLKVRVEPFYRGRDSYPFTLFPYAGYLPPLKAGTEVYVYPISGDTDAFIFAGLVTPPSDLPSSLQFEGASITSSPSEFVLETQGGMTLESASGKVYLNSSINIDVGNPTESILSIVGDLAQAVSAAITIPATPGSPLTLDPTTIAALLEISARATVLKG